MKKVASTFERMGRAEDSACSDTPGPPVNIRFPFAVHFTADSVTWLKGDVSRAELRWFQICTGLGLQSSDGGVMWWTLRGQTRLGLDWAAATEAYVTEVFGGEGAFDCRWLAGLEGEAVRPFTVLTSAERVSFMPLSSKETLSEWEVAGVGPSEKGPKISVMSERERRAVSFALMLS